MTVHVKPAGQDHPLGDRDRTNVQIKYAIAITTAKVVVVT